MDTPITGHDVLIYLNIGATIAGFFLLYIKHEKRLTSIEAHLFHIMRALSMKPREPFNNESKEN